MTTTIFYKKVGRRYVAVSQYDNELVDALPKGSHLVQVYPGGRSTLYNVNPNYAAMIAAGRVAEEKICDALRKASDLRPSRSPITEGQRRAWQQLSKEFGEECHTLTWPSARDAANEAVSAMIEEANKLLENPAVKEAFDHFLFIAELTKKNENR